MTDQLRQLARPFPRNLIAQKPGGFSANYVAHSTVTERLLQVIGPFSFEVSELIRDHDGTVTGALCRLTATIDGREVTVQEVGDVEHADQKSGDGARAKDASSDGLKRCAMRLGCGLHLWSGGDYYLYDRLSEAATDETGAPAEGS